MRGKGIGESDVKTCNRCGLKGHQSVMCTEYVDVRCGICSRTGHTDAACWWSGYDMYSNLEVSNLDIRRGYEDFAREHSGGWGESGAKGSGRW